MTELERQYAAYGEGVECIWGSASIEDPLMPAGGNLWTMNDISIVHYTDTDEYGIELNGMKRFQFPQKYGPKQYIGELMDKLREWMLSTGRDIDYPVSTYDLFITGANINSRYTSIEELYSSFEKLATNFIESNIVD